MVYNKSLTDQVSGRMINYCIIRTILCIFV